MKGILGFMLVSGSLAASTVREIDNTTYSITAHYRIGEQHRYKIVTAIQGIGDNQRAVGVTTAVRYKVTKVKDGIATMLLTYDNSELPVTLDPISIRLDHFNRPAGNSASAQIFAILPNHPVKIGDKWSGMSNVRLGPKSGALVETSYKLDGVKKDAGKTLAVLSMNLHGATPGDGTAIIDLSTGGLLSSALNLRLNDKHGHIYPVQVLLRREG